MKWFLYVAFLATTAAASTPARAAGAEGGDAVTRATLYQAEARAIFEKDHWAITREGKGSFTAVHRALENGGSSQQTGSPPLMVHVSVTFNPQSASQTDCSVKIEGYQLATRKDGKKPRVVGPFKADYPENTKYIQNVLTKAEDELGRKYPKYQVK